MGCLHSGEGLKDPVAVLSTTRNDPRISSLQYERLIFQVQFGAPFDHIAGGFVVALGCRGGSFRRGGLPKDASPE